MAGRKLPRGAVCYLCSGVLSQPPIFSCREHSAPSPWMPGVAKAVLATTMATRPSVRARRRAAAAFAPAWLVLQQGTSCIVMEKISCTRTA